MGNLKKWELLSAEDVSQSPWYPMEKRSYRMPNGKIVDDFYVTTLQDSVHVVPMTADRKMVMIRMYKQGTDDFMIQWPAGRYEPERHLSQLSGARIELAEEAGIIVPDERLESIGVLALQSTKGTERMHGYFARDVTIAGAQQLDETEEIEVLTYSPSEVDAMILSGEIWDGPCIAFWYMAKAKYPKMF